MFKKTTEENLVVSNKDNRVFMSRSEVAPYKFDVFKPSIFVLEASLLGQIFVLRTSIFAGQLSSTETLYCLISVQWLGVADKIATFPRYELENFY